MPKTSMRRREYQAHASQRQKVSTRAGLMSSLTCNVLRFLKSYPDLPVVYIEMDNPTSYGASSRTGTRPKCRWDHVRGLTLEKVVMSAKDSTNLRRIASLIAERLQKAWLLAGATLVGFEMEFGRDQKGDIILIGIEADSLVYPIRDSSSPLVQAPIASQKLQLC